MVSQQLLERVIADVGRHVRASKGDGEESWPGNARLPMGVDS